MALQGKSKHNRHEQQRQNGQHGPEDDPVKDCIGAVSNPHGEPAGRQGDGKEQHEGRSEEGEEGHSSSVS